MTTDDLGSAGLPNCLTKGCHRRSAAAIMRGLCLPCYSIAKKLVESGKTTWEELVSLGLATGGTDADPFTKAFNNAKGK